MEVKLYDLIIPKVGMGITEVDLMNLRVKVGDKVIKGDIICQIEMEKASTELESEVSGIVEEVFFKVGDTIEVGSVVCRIKEE